MAGLVALTIYRSHSHTKLWAESSFSHFNVSYNHLQAASRTSIEKIVGIWLTTTFTL